MTKQSTTPASRQEPFAPSDEAARRVITGNLDDTLFVEASAGTGKTTSLVQRIVNLVVTGRTTMDRVAAITFTEAAAAELRDRIREYLERGALDPERADSERELCRRGAEDLDQANIRTLHAFAAQLLHERPLDAGLPPGFETSDEIVAGIAFDEAWSDWLDVVLEEDSPIGGDLAMALSQGVTLANLKKLAEAFHENYADLNEGGFAVPADTAGASVEALRRQWPEAERLCQFSKIGTDDRLCDYVHVRMPTVQALLGTEPGTTLYFNQLGKLLPLKSDRRGSKGNWEFDPHKEGNAIDALRGIAEGLDKVITEELERASERAFANILNEVQRFVLDYVGNAEAGGPGRIPGPAGVGAGPAAGQPGSPRPLSAAVLIPVD